MIRDTSIEAFNKIKENGLLSRTRFKTYELLFEHGPMTANELMKIAKKLNPNLSHQSIESFGRRLSELRDSGVAIELREVVCSVSGHRCIQWEVTKKLPIKFEKTKRIKCEHCDGKGYTETTQSKMF